MSTLAQAARWASDHGLDPCPLAPRLRPWMVADYDCPVPTEGELLALGDQEAWWKTHRIECLTDPARWGDLDRAMFNVLLNQINVLRGKVGLAAVTAAQYRDAVRVELAGIVQ